MRYIKTDIPVKTYVRKYIQAKYPGPITVSTNNTIGCYLYAVLEKSNSPWHKRKYSIKAHENSNPPDHLPVLLPANENTLYRTGFEIPKCKAILINSFFEDMIVQELHYRCQLYNKVGFSRYQAIEDFCDDYQIYIDEDITVAALKKAEYRYRKNKKKYLPHLSPPLNTIQKRVSA